MEKAPEKSDLCVQCSYMSGEESSSRRRRHPPLLFVTSMTANLEAGEADVGRTRGAGEGVGYVIRARWCSFNVAPFPFLSLSLSVASR